MKNYYGYIYLVTDLINSMKYIGQKKGRFKSNYFGSGKIIRRAIKKHRISNFKVKLIDYASSKEELNELEKAWIKDLNCISPKGYNLSEGGNGGKCWDVNPMQGKHHTKNTIDKISIIKKGKPHKHPVSEKEIYVLIPSYSLKTKAYKFFGLTTVNSLKLLFFILLLIVI